MSARIKKSIPGAFECLGCSTFECSDSWSLSTLSDPSVDESLALLWLQSHLLVWPSVICALTSKHAEEQICVLKKQRPNYPLAWVCPSCHSCYPSHGSLLTNDGQKNAAQCLTLIYLFVHGESPSSICRESRFCQHSVCQHGKLERVLPNRTFF